MELNERIKKYRKEAGLSQEDLAAKIYVSKHKASVGRRQIRTAFGQELH